MRKPNYGQEKRMRDLAKQAKKEAKRLSKLEQKRKLDPANPIDPTNPIDPNKPVE